MKNILKSLIFLLIATFAFQGFQCGSREFTSAKTSLSRGDTLKAIDYLKQEQIKNPENNEANVLLADLLYRTATNGNEVNDIQKLRESAKMSITSFNKATKPREKEFAKMLQQNIWVSAFNGGIAYLDKIGNENGSLDSAIALFDIGQIVRPRKLSFVNLKGMAYSKADMADMEEKANKEYAKLLMSNDKKMLDMGVYLGMPISEAIEKIGQPGPARIDTTTKGGNQYLKISQPLASGSDKVMLYAEKGPSDTEPVVKGWIYGIPDNYGPNDLLWTDINTTPMALLAERSFRAKKYDESIGYLDKLLMYDPNDQQLNQMRVQAYVDKGDGDVAVEKLTKLTKENPDRKEYYQQLGDLYRTMEQYDKAIEAYTSAVDIDPNFDFALRNLASVYKNKAAGIQAIEIEKQEADKNYAPKTDLYFPLLKKSAEYFERTIQTERFSEDYDSYVELYNIYDVMKDESKSNEAIKRLERLEPKVPSERKSSYYYTLLKIYSSRKMDGKVKEVSAKINQLENQ